MASLRSVLVTPLSGPLARYGRSTAEAITLWSSSIQLPSPWTAVSLEVHDAHPDPAGAMRAATADDPHVVFGPYGSSPAVTAIPVTALPVWNHGGATSRLAWPAFPNTINVLAPASSYLVGALEAMRSLGAKIDTACLLHGATGFARDVAGGAARAARRLGFEIQLRSFAPGCAAQAARSLPTTDAVLVAGGFDDEVDAATVLTRGPWVAIALVSAGVEEVLAGLGSLREGLIGPAQWLPGAALPVDEGPDAEWFSTAFRDATGSDPEYPAAQAFAAGVLVRRCLRDGTVADQLAAVRSLRCRTLLGDFRLDPSTGRQIGHQVLTVQWQRGRRRVIWPPERAERELVLRRER